MTKLIESTGALLAEAKVDRENRMLLGVALLGSVSKNGRRYSKEALRDAVRLYDGVNVYLDHPPLSERRDRKGTRSVRDLVGKIRNPRLAGDRVRGDLQLLQSGEGAGVVLAMAETMPDAAGASHRARGKVRAGTDGQPDVVTGLEDVAGVDIVTDPATVDGLFESVREAGGVPWDEITVEDLRQHRPDLVEALQEERTEWDALVREKLQEVPEKARTAYFREKMREADSAEELDRLVQDRQRAWREAVAAANAEASRRPRPGRAFGAREPKLDLERFEEQLFGEGGFGGNGDGPDLDDADRRLFGD